MKIVSFEEFVELPEGTIFSYYEPAFCAGLYRKGETIYNAAKAIDYFEESLVPNCWTGAPPTVGDGEGRWGAYELDQEYALYEPEDVATLIALIQGTYYLE